MKFQEILLILSAVSVLVAAEHRDTKHERDHLHKKSYHSQVQEEKSQSRILNRNKQFKSENQRNHYRNFIYRDGNENCSWVCHDENGKPSKNSLELQVYYNGNASLIGIVDKPSNIALVVDGHNNVTAIINGKSGRVVVIDIKSRLIYAISNPQAADLKSGFDVYFQNLSSLQNLLNVAKQSPEKYNFSSVNPSVLGDLGSLGWGRTCSEEDLNEIALFTTQLTGPLAFLYQNKGSFNIPKNAQRFVRLNLALATLLYDNQDSLQSLHIQLDLESVFGASSGVEGILSLLSQIGKHKDLSKLLFKYLRSPGSFLHLLLEITKGRDDGIDGLISILAKIIDVITGEGSVSEVVNSIVHYNPESDGKSSNLSQIISETLDLIRSQNTSFQNFPPFKGIYDIILALNNNNLMWNNLNISDLIKLLQFPNPKEVMQTISKIFSQFVSSQGIHHLINYIKNVPDFGNVVQTALRGYVSQILSDVNVTALLSKFPVFGDIIHQISSALGNEFDIGHYLNSSSIVRCFSDVIGGNSDRGPFGNIIGTFTNGISEVESGIEHGIGGLLGTVTGGFLGSGSGNASTSESPSEIPITTGNSAIATGGFQLNGSSFGFGQISNRKKISHEKHNLHEKKDNKLHHNFQQRKPQHEHPHH